MNPRRRPDRPVGRPRGRPPVRPSAADRVAPRQETSMRTSTRTRTLGVMTAAVLALGACGAPGSGGGQAETTATGTSGLPTCEPVAGETLVVLEDDLGLQ